MGTPRGKTYPGRPIQAEIQRSPKKEAGARRLLQVLSGHYVFFGSPPGALTVAGILPYD